MIKVVSVLVVILISVVTYITIKDSKTKSGEVNVKLQFNQNSSVEFFEAIKSGNIDLVEKSLNSGMSPDAKDANTDTALIVASRLGKTEIVKLLVQKGADINMKNNQGLIPMRAAAVAEHNEIVRILMIENQKRMNSN